MLLDALMITPGKLRAFQKVPVPVPALRALLSLAIAALPFDEESYTGTYPDLADARDSGSVADLRKPAKLTNLWRNKVRVMRLLKQSALPGLKKRNLGDNAGRGGCRAARLGHRGCAPLNPPALKGKEGCQHDIANERQSPRARPPWAWSLRAVRSLRLAAQEI